MDKSSLLEALRAETGFSIRQAKQVVKLFFDELSNALASGERVALRGFCNFYVKHHKGYTGRNPKTGVPTQVPPKKLPFFRCGLELKERVDHKWSKNNKGRKAVMANLKKDLNAVTKELKSLTKKTERLIKAADKLEKAQAAAKRKPKVKAKITTRVPAKKKVIAKKRTPARKRAAKLTASEQVLRIIKRSKKGVDVATLKKKTEIGERTVRNILYKASKARKIKRIAVGVYVAA